jgi:hypothetical protein
MKPIPHPTAAQLAGLTACLKAGRDLKVVSLRDPFALRFVRELAIEGSISYEAFASEGN